MGFCLCLLCVARGSAVPAGASLRTAADKNQITIGDRVALTLSLVAPGSCRLTEPEKITALGPWIVKDVRTERCRAPGGESPCIVYTLTTFTTGQVTIPSVEVRYDDDSNTQNSIQSEPVAITVASVLDRTGTESDIRDIKPPLSLPVPLAVYLAWLGALAAAAAGFWYWYRRYQQRQAVIFPAAAVPSVPPYQAAMEALETLKRSGLVAEGRINEFYIALSEIIRDYLAAIYAVETRDKTSAELYTELKGRETDRKALGFIKDFFEECDFVKFAKYRPDETICWQDWEMARSIVEG